MGLRDKILCSIAIAFMAISFISMLLPFCFIIEEEKLFDYMYYKESMSILGYSYHVSNFGHAPGTWEVMPGVFALLAIIFSLASTFLFSLTLYLKEFKLISLILSSCAFVFFFLEFQRIIDCGYMPDLLGYIVFAFEFLSMMIYTYLCLVSRHSNL